MFNTDSLAWQWRIPELARQIYPSVSWLYRSITVWPGFPVIGLFFGLAELRPDRCVVGLSRQDDGSMPIAIAR